MIQGKFIVLLDLIKFQASYDIRLPKVGKSAGGKSGDT